MAEQGYIRTIEEMETLYYGRMADLLLRKADDPLLTTTSGVYNAVYGALVWLQLNLEANVFGALPKYPWIRSGWRIAITKPGTTASGGVAEGGAIPDSMQFTYAEVSTKPKQIAHVIEVSDIQHFIATETEDDAFGSTEQQRFLMGVRHKDAMNEMLMVNVETQTKTADYSGTSAFETLDRVVSSDSEEDAFGGTFNNWYDIYGLDRDTATTYDSQVLHNSGTDRSLTDDLIKNLYFKCRKAGGNPSFWLTGYDTYNAILGLYVHYGRYVLGEQNIQVGVNGIQTANGIEAGFQVATLYGLPVIVSKDVPADTIDRIFLLDISDVEGFGLPRLGLMIAKPVQYYEAGISSGNPFAIGKLTNKGMFRTMGEMVARNLTFQGKLRDLKS